MNTIVLEEPVLVKEIQEAAEQAGLEAADFVTQAVRRHLAVYRQKRIEAETEAWYALPAEKRKEYEGRFVAVYNGEVVDNDIDRMVLYFRLRQRYGRQPILITEGGDYPIPVYRIRSPRQVREDSVHSL
jgi:hypothetical protein